MATGLRLPGCAIHSYSRTLQVFVQGYARAWYLLGYGQAMACICSKEIRMDLLLILILLLLLSGGGGGLYWGFGAGWGIGPIGLIVAVIIVAYLLSGYRGRRGPPPL